MSVGRTPTYRSWESMKQRCTNPNATGYENYGGRGIGMDPRWTSFQNFHEDMGDRPYGTTLDRVDNNASYSKENCRWATRQEQNANKRSVRLVVAFDESKTLDEWIVDPRCSISKSTLWTRLQDGWPDHYAVSAPKYARKP